MTHEPDPDAPGAPEQSGASPDAPDSPTGAHTETARDGSDRPDQPTRMRPHRDADLAEHDLSDHDEALFTRHEPQGLWRHLRTVGAGILLGGLVATGVAAAHLADMSMGTIGNAVLIPNERPVNLRLEAGEERMLYTERGFGTTRCTVTDEAEAPVTVHRTNPVLLQGSDVLWHGQSIFAAPKPGDYTVTCSSLQPERQVRVGRPVGTLDVILTVAAAGAGGAATLLGLGLLGWGVARRRGPRAAGAQVDAAPSA